MSPHVRTRYLPHGVTIEHSLLLDNVTLANILINFGQQLLAARPSAPEKTEPHHSKLPPPRGRRRLRGDGPALEVVG
jgi:hypothetical protein